MGSLDSKYGRFVDPDSGLPIPADGRIVHASWDRRDRTDYLGYPVVFVDSDGEEWVVPVGTAVNGLSVPRFFWRLMPPYAGRAREASVVHDWMCLKPHPTDSVTAARVFYDAMRANGVCAWTAWTRWLAVRWFGPRFRKE
jgi:hypothetical protein